MRSKREIEGDVVNGWADRKRITGEYRRDEQGRVELVQTPYWELQGPLTPVEARYTLAQIKMPEPVLPHEWSFSIEGLVEQPLRIDLDDLKKFPPRTVRCVHECAGNDGALLDYMYKNDGAGEKPSRFGFGGLQQGFTGALLSAGEWTGVPLSAILEKAGMKPEALSVLAAGFDRGVPSERTDKHRGGAEADLEQNFMKALPMDKALDPDTIVAYALNGEYLRHVHGAPMRLIVPGWAGNWSVKWLEKLELLEYMPPVFYQTLYFIYGDGPDDPNRHMITAMGVKSIITEPRESESPLSTGSYPITGVAYGGRGMITRVEISTDGGESWTDAELEEPREKWMWARFFHLWDAKPGKYTLMARAYDEAGRQQPVTPWNFQKKMFDGIVPVGIDVVPD